MHTCYFCSPHIYSGVYSILYKHKQSSTFHAAPPRLEHPQLYHICFCFLTGNQSTGFRHINEELQVHKPTLRVCEVWMTTSKSPNCVLWQSSALGLPVQSWDLCCFCVYAFYCVLLCCLMNCTRHTVHPALAPCNFLAWLYHRDL